MGRPYTDPAIRFRSKILPQPNGCWHYDGYHDPSGYGIFGISDGKCFKAHRYSAQLHGMDITDMFVCHHCDNPGCINPDHLFIGTHADNMKDMAIKNRCNRWEHQLSHNHVRKIKQLLKTPMQQKDIAKQLGVNPGQVSRIKLNQSFRHIT
tara:strand:+ start:54 stop:506 length:453 start_codon:yes stop_codon:yes gene_type:complete